MSYLRREGRNSQKPFGGDVFQGKEKMHSITAETNCTEKTLKRDNCEGIQSPDKEDMLTKGELAEISIQIETSVLGKEWGVFFLIIQ